MDSFLMIGQSNMAGRGRPNEVLPIENSKLFVLRNGRWQPMFVPINCDRPFSGISLAESFADMYAKHYDENVGLIPCAEGNTSIDEWMPGEILYDHAVLQAKLAMRTSKIVGILWHQGEADCSEGHYAVYAEKLKILIDALRRDLNLQNVPFIIGELGYFLNENKNNELKNYIYINKALQEVADNDSKVGLVSAEGLTANTDMLHFNATSLREFGIRYYNVFQSVDK